MAKRVSLSPRRGGVCFGSWRADGDAPACSFTPPSPPTRTVRDRRAARSTPPTAPRGVDGDAPSLCGRAAALLPSENGHFLTSWPSRGRTTLLWPATCTPLAHTGAPDRNAPQQQLRPLAAVVVGGLLLLLAPSTLDRVGSHAGRLCKGGLEWGRQGSYYPVCYAVAQGCACAPAGLARLPRGGRCHLPGSAMAPWRGRGGAHTRTPLHGIE